MSRIVVSLSVATVLAGVYAVLITAIPVIAQEPRREPPTPSKPDIPKAISSDTVALSVDHLQEGELTKITIRWQGQPAPSLLVVSVDGADREEYMSQRADHSDSAELTGIKVLRRITAQGDISIVLSRDGVRDLLGPGDWLVNVCITKEINLLISIEDPSVKGGGRVVRQERIDVANGPSDLRFLAGARGAAALEALFPSLKPFTVNVPENGFSTTLIEPRMLSAFLTFTIPKRSPSSER